MQPKLRLCHSGCPQATIKIWNPKQGKAVTSLGAWAAKHGLQLPGYVRQAADDEELLAHQEPQVAGGSASSGLDTSGATSGLPSFKKARSGGGELWELWAQQAQQQPQLQPQQLAQHQLWQQQQHHHHHHHRLPHQQPHQQQQQQLPHQLPQRQHQHQQHQQLWQGLRSPSEAATLPHLSQASATSLSAGALHELHCGAPAAERLVRPLAGAPGLQLPAAGASPEGYAHLAAGVLIRLDVLFSAVSCLGGCQEVGTHVQRVG
jgi:hypothetical protein